MDIMIRNDSENNEIYLEQYENRFKVFRLLRFTGNS
jgi:hypothetical protein